MAVGLGAAPSAETRKQNLQLTTLNPSHPWGQRGYVPLEPGCLPGKFRDYSISNVPWAKQDCEWVAGGRGRGDSAGMKHWPPSRGSRGALGSVAAGECLLQSVPGPRAGAQQLLRPQTS